jgi:glutaminyl-peptide cyclotransferase
LDRQGRASLLRFALAAGLVLSAVSCKRPAPAGSPADTVAPTDGTGTPSPSQDTNKLPPSSSRAPDRTAPAPVELWKEFSGERAFAEARQQTEFGPRPAGSVELEKTRGYIRTTLQGLGWDIEEQPFTDQTPRGPIRFVNVIARFSANHTRPAPSSTQQAIVCSHYDTKRFSTIQFLGANDGASSTGALLELARVLALDPALAAKIELVFFDGEEAFAQFSESDGLYGSRFYARSLREKNRAAQMKFGILWDMIGDKDLMITFPPDSPQPLTEQLFTAADAVGLRARFGYYNRSVWDDHVPLNQAHVPTVDIIDFDYLYWHTADDTIDKLSPESLRVVGAVTLYHLRHALRHE